MSKVAVQDKYLLPKLFIFLNAAGISPTNPYDAPLLKIFMI